MVQKIAGCWSGHDSSFVVLHDGKPVIHAEFERYSREKCAPSDSLKFLMERYPDYESISELAIVYPVQKYEKFQESLESVRQAVSKNGGNITVVPHHAAHACNAFFSSDFEEALIFTIDGGGVENKEGVESAMAVWSGEGLDVQNRCYFSPRAINIGGVWSRVTRYVFKLQNGWPLGGQEGTIMAMAAFGDPTRFSDDFYKMLTADVIPAGMKPPTQPIGAYVAGKDPTHPYLDRWAKLADENEKNLFDLAAGLQAATERLLDEFVTLATSSWTGQKNICTSGGVALNSVAMGQLYRKYTDMGWNVYIPPVPYDGGLSIGAAQYVYHSVLRNPRIAWEDNCSPYLGETWPIDEGFLDCVMTSGMHTKFNVEIDDVCNLLEKGHIVSVFNEGSESGRRALGNRSILADPRNPEMKNIVNLKVKHRQWFRPFAPSILREKVTDWFTHDVNSPYMQYVMPIRDDKQDQVPAICHHDGSARLQTVSEKDNPWYYSLLKKWEEKTGVPILLNTSFNDREPICETPGHALNCFLGTDIDDLYISSEKILISKKKEVTQ